MAQPLRGLFNDGNTCWCASAVQALRGVPSFAKQFSLKTLLGKALRQDAIDVATVKRLYSESRKVIHAGPSTPEDPAEFLITLFDKENICAKPFESSKAIAKQCCVCGHVRSETSKECMVIVPSIPACASPIQRALDIEFGFKVAAAPKIANPQSSTSQSAEEAKDTETKSFLGGVPGEKWWKCDDERVHDDVSLTSAAPYLLFYAERSVANSFNENEEEKYDSDDEMNETTEESSKAPTAEMLEHLLPDVNQIRTLDCEGQCKGKRTKHRVFVYEYEASKALIVHVQCPRSMPLCHIERTLFASEGEEKDSSAAFDLQAMVCRVGMSHYVCYRRETTLN